MKRETREARRNILQMNISEALMENKSNIKTKKITRTNLVFMGSLVLGMFMSSSLFFF